MLGIVGDAPLTPVWAQYFDGKDPQAVFNRMKMSDGQGILNAAIRELTIARQNAMNAGDNGAALVYEMRLRQVMSLSSQIYGGATGADITDIGNTAAREGAVTGALAGVSGFANLVVLGVVALIILQIAGPSLGQAFSRAVSGGHRA